MTSTSKLMIRATATVVLAAALAPLVPGQQSGPTEAEQFRRAMIEARERDIRDNELRERAFDLRMLEVEARKPRARRQPKLAYAQIREDFKSIQIVNNDLTRAASRRGSLDLELIEKLSSEIKKRAARLKDNMVLPESESVFDRPQAEAGVEAAQLKSSLSVLDGLITEFVDNPIFKEANLVDVQLSAKARRDLEEIIEVCDQVKKLSGKLKKTAQKTP